MNRKIIALCAAVVMAVGAASGLVLAQSGGGAGAPATDANLVVLHNDLTTLNTTAGGPVNNLAASGADPCFGSLKINVPVNSAVANTQLVAPVSAKKVYICSFLVVAGGTAAVSLAEGTGALCNTAAQAGIVGVAANGTLSAGVPLVVNAGFQMGSGSGTVAMTNTAANGVCIVQSATVQLSGNMTYVQQ